jgi:hypothetical protein
MALDTNVKDPQSKTSCNVSYPLIGLIVGVGIGLLSPRYDAEFNELKIQVREQTRLLDSVSNMQYRQNNIILNGFEQRDPFVYTRMIADDFGNPKLKEQFIELNGVRFYSVYEGYVIPQQIDD